MRNSLYVALLAALAAPSVDARQKTMEGTLLQSSRFTREEQRRIPWPRMAFGPGPKGRMIAGDFDDDGRDDAILLDGNVPVFIPNPAQYNGLQELEITADDIAVVPAVGSGGSTTSVVVNSQGIHHITRNGKAFEFKPLGDAAWDGALRIAVAETPSTGALAFVGVDASGRKLLIWLDPFGVPTPTSVVNAAGVILDLVALDWTGDGDDEVAVLRDTGLAVYELDGPLVFWSPLALSDGFLAAFRTVDSGGERLAVVSAGVKGKSQALLVLDRTIVEAPISLGTMGAHAATVSDVDADGDDDLLLSTDGPQAVLLYNANQAGASTFAVWGNGGELIRLRSFAASSVNPHAQPVLHDFSRDGDADLLVFLAGRSELLYLENQETLLADRVFKVRSGDLVFDENTPSVFLRLDLGTPVVSPLAATHLEVMGFVQSGVGLGATATSIAVTVPLPPWPSWNAQVIVPLPEPDPDMTNVYDLELRPVAVGGGGAVVDSGPSVLFAFCVSADDVVQIEESANATGIPLSSYLVPLGQTEEQAVTFVASGGRDLTPTVILIPEIEIEVPDPGTD